MVLLLLLNKSCILYLWLSTTQERLSLPYSIMQSPQIFKSTSHHNIFVLPIEKDQSLDDRRYHPLISLTYD